MAQRGQFVRRQRWKMDLEAFMSNFAESSHPRSTHLLYKVCWLRTGNTWKNLCENDPPDHAEIVFLENECEKIKKWKSKPCYITWYLSWSPCGRCSCDILEFLDEHPKVTLDIRAARLYKHDDERNRQGLRDLDDNGVKISIMDYDDYSNCFRTFVAHPWSDMDYWLQQIYSEEHYSDYSEELDWILGSW